MRTEPRLSRRVLPVLLLVAAVLVTAAVTTRSWSDENPRPLDPPSSARKSDEQGERNDPEDADVAERMQRKLVASQAVLKGLVNGDMRLVRREADVLRSIARGPHWNSYEDDAVFSHFNVEFQRLSEKLGRMAEGRNLEGAAYVNNELTSTCISCHEHVRDVKQVPRILPLGGERSASE